MDITAQQRDEIVHAVTELLGEAHDVLYHQYAEGDGWAYIDADAATVFAQADDIAERIEAKATALRNALIAAKRTARLRRGR